MNLSIKKSPAVKPRALERAIRSEGDPSDADITKDMTMIYNHEFPNLASRSATTRHKVPTLTGRPSHQVPVRNNNKQRELLAILKKLSSSKDHAGNIQDILKRTNDEALKKKYRPIKNNPSYVLNGSQYVFATLQQKIQKIDPILLGNSLGKISQLFAEKGNYCQLNDAKTISKLASIASELYKEDCSKNKTRLVENPMLIMNSIISKPETFRRETRDSLAIIFYLLTKVKML